MALFSPTTFYRLTNTALPNNLTLSSGISQSTSGALEMNTIETYSSSENWQFLFQDDRYFIRNWDYRNLWQLGVSSAASSRPALLEIEAGVGQQWFVERDGDGDDNNGGTFTIWNEEVGKNQALGVGMNGDQTPQLTPNMEYARWVVDPNQSAGEVPAEMLLPVKVVEPEPTATSSKATTDSPSTSAISVSTSSGASSTSPSSGSGELSSTSSSSESSGISTGAIAGVAVGALAVISLVILILWFLRRRSRRRHAPTSTSHQTKSDPAYSDDSDRTRFESSGKGARSDPNDSPKGISAPVVHEKAANSRFANELESPSFRQSPVELPGNSR